MATRQYIGARYVPKIDGEWNAQKSYEGLTVVTYNGASYTSKKSVPVGININNNEYWVLTGNYNAQVESYREISEKIANDINFCVRRIGTVSEVIDFTEGMIIFSRGYYVENDGGGGYYYVSKTKANDLSVATVDGYFLNHIFGDTINANEIGLSTKGYTSPAKNSDIMENYIALYANIPLVFSSGVYGFAREISFPDSAKIELNGATLKYVGVAEIDYFISIRRGSTRSDYAFPSISGGVIDGNYSTNSLISFHKCKGTVLHDMRLIRSNKYGIRASSESSPDGAFRIENVSIENTKDITENEVVGTTGIYDNAFDNIYDNVEIINFQRAILTYASRFSHIQAWIRSRNLLENSIFAFVDGYDVTFSDISVDTYRVGFKINNYNQNCLINNMLWITNKSVYNDELRTSFPRIIFTADYPDRIYNVSNCYIPNEDNLTFSNIALTYSKFVNISFAVPSVRPSTVLGNNFKTLDRRSVPTSLSASTDQYGQIAYSDIDNVVAANLLSHQGFVTKIGVGFKCFKVDDSGTVTLLNNATVKIGIILNNTY